MVLYIFSVSSKGKGVYFKRRNPYITACSLKRWAYKEIKVYITACSLNVGYTKKLKVYYMNQNLTFNFFPEQMIEWKVACLWNDEKTKTWIYAPRHHTNVPESCIVNWWNWGPLFGHLSWDQIQLFFFAKIDCCGR